MSFSKETKSELCNANIFKKEEKIAQVYGMVLFSRIFSENNISLSTESHSVAVLYANELSALTNTIVDLNVKLTRRGGEKNIYTLSVPDTNK